MENLNTIVLKPYIICIDQNIYQGFLSSLHGQQPFNEQQTQANNFIPSQNSYFDDVHECIDVKSALTLLLTDRSNKFRETFIIVSGRLFASFVGEFQNNITEIFVIPKILVFNSSKTRIPLPFTIQHKDFYYYGGVFTSFGEIKDYINKQKKFIQIKGEQIQGSKSKFVDKLIFDQVKNWEEIVFPSKYKKFMDEEIDDKEIFKFNKNLYSLYSEKHDEYKKLLSHIIDIPDIPIELLSKYYARFYTVEGQFYGNMKRDLLDDDKKKMNFYIPFIKTMYLGVEKGGLKKYFKGELYSGQKIGEEEIRKLYKYKDDRIAGLPISTLFSRGFISFSIKREVAEGFLSEKDVYGNPKKNTLLIIANPQKANEIYAQADIQSLSVYEDREAEVLFFPFAIFGIENFYKDEKKRYNIALLNYMGKIDKEIVDKIKESDEYVPNNNFKILFEESGLVSKSKKDKMKNLKLKDLSEEYEIKVAKSKKKKVIIAFIIVAIILAGILIPVLIVTNKDDSKSKSSSNNNRLSLSIPTCDEGFYKKEGSTSCEKCPSGKSSKPGASSCFVCPAGTFSNNKFKNCEKCKEGTYSEEGASECLDCPEGTYSNISGATICNACPAGTKSYQRTSCIKCPKGTYSENSGSFECLECPKDSYSENEGATTCTKCLNGYCSEPGSSFCYECE